MNKPSVQTIRLLHRELLEKDYYSFDFTKPEGFTFVEGQYGVFGHIDKEIEGKKLRAFSFASTNEEAFIRIATKISPLPSDFKDKLYHLSIGDEMSMNAALGEFVLEKASDAIFIAGGIGITPIRAMILSKERNARKRMDTLIYSELDSIYPFKREMENLQGLKVIFAADIEPTQSAVIQSAKEHLNDSYYYLSGSPGFVKGITGLLKEQGISEKQIKFDIFIGY